MYWKIRIYILNYIINTKKAPDISIVGGAFCNAPPTIEIVYNFEHANCDKKNTSYIIRLHNKKITS